ncbi:MAG: hypothetical protein K6E36_06475 [Oscillospiraceae bacterium]|nr:hypothetical protein [Oscillospiraceae bacterium]
MQLVKFAAAAAALLLLSGCGENGSDHTMSTASPHNTDSLLTAASDSVTTAEAKTTSRTAQQTQLTTDRTVSESTASHTSASVSETVSTASSSLAQGGEGGEDHASDPDPEFFTYRFFPDSVSMRLAGGNYQTVFYDFEAALEHDVNSLYHLADYNFDSKPDLVVPVEFSKKNITYAVFLWNPDTLHFQTEPLLLCNPQTDAATQTVSSLTYESEARPETVLRFFRWENSSLSEVRALIADFSALTLTDVPADGSESIVQFESEDALRTALQQQFLSAGSAD